jgi:hypothetical protein
MGERRRRLALVVAPLVGAVALSACIHVTNPKPPPPPPPPAGTFSGLGFDACAAPSAPQMQAWLASPYRAIGIYVGGLNRACSQPELTPTWISAVASQGWHLAPLYVGYQAPCSGIGTPIDPNNAPNLGVASASDAAHRAFALGLQPGTPIYFDMEAYNTSDANCVNVVRTFITYWVQELHGLGYVAGFYSSILAGIDAEASAVGNPGYEIPDAIWFAHWNNAATVYGDRYLSDSYWVHQRIHQYQGGHDESWGGVVINIDNDAFDAKLST